MVWRFNSSKESRQLASCLRIFSVSLKETRITLVCALAICFMLNSTPQRATKYIKYLIFVLQATYSSLKTGAQPAGFLFLFSMDSTLKLHPRWPPYWKTSRRRKDVVYGDISSLQFSERICCHVESRVDPGIELVVLVLFYIFLLLVMVSTSVRKPGSKKSRTSK